MILQNSIDRNERRKLTRIISNLINVEYIDAELEANLKDINVT